MEARELRIGNWVKDFTGFVQVKALGELVLYCDGVSQGYDCVSGIELTEELLVKCGFEKVREYFHIDNEFIILKDSRGYYCHIFSGNIYLSSVHQLQNLYYALTGTELEIKLWYENKTIFRICRYKD